MPQHQQPMTVINQPELNAQALIQDEFTQGGGAIRILVLGGPCLMNTPKRLRIAAVDGSFTQEMAHVAVAPNSKDPRHSF